MKYIRTKNGKIYELQETKNGEKYLVRNGELIPLWNTKAYEILTQSDTIEELCDEFVLVWDKKHWPYSTMRQYELYRAYGILKRSMREELNYGYTLNFDYQVFGAIWTDRGLIFVAKMNEEGEFELL